MSITSSKIFETVPTSDMVAKMSDYINEHYTSLDKKYVHGIFGAHESVNQKYDDHVYSYHLLLALYFGYKYSWLCPKFNLIKLAIVGHDTIEDTNLTYNDIIKLFHSPKDWTSKFIVEIIYAVTNEKGRTRKERANAKYYKGIRKTPGAVFTKLCDRLANSYYSKEQQSSMIKAYQKEMIDFILSIGYSRNHYYSTMFNELSHICDVSLNIKTWTFSQQLKFYWNSFNSSSNLH